MKKLPPPFSSCAPSSGTTAGGPVTLIEMQPMGLSANHPAGYTSSSNKSSPARSASVQHRRTRPTDLASFDSSDTWASCNPFPSITDLAGWSPQSGGPADQLLYVKPLPEEQQMQANYVTTDETSRLLFQHINEVTQPDDASVRKVPCRHHHSHTFSLLDCIFMLLTCASVAFLLTNNNNNL